jgi:hypothetical protein
MTGHSLSLRAEVSIETPSVAPMAPDRSGSASSDGRTGCTPRRAGWSENLGF